MGEMGAALPAVDLGVGRTVAQLVAGWAHTGALFTNGDDYLVGGLIGVLSGPIAYLIFKAVYRGTTDQALEGSTITSTGELTEFGAEIEGATS